MKFFSFQFSVFSIAILLAAAAVPSFGADLSRGVTFTDGQRVSAAQLHQLVDSATIVSGFYTAKTAATNLSSTDLVLVYSPSLGVFRKIDAQTFLFHNTALITTAPEKTAVQNNDFMLLYDATGTVMSKAAVSNVFNVLQQPAITNWNTNYTFYVNDGTNTWKLSALNLQNYLATNFQAFLSLTNTNVALHTNLVDADRFLIYDSAGNSNKFTQLSTLKAAITNASILGAFKNLVITNNASTNKMNLVADEIVTKTTNGACFLCKNVNVVIDATASGTNGMDNGIRTSNAWYYIFAISDGTNVAGLFSTNKTWQVMPTNYIYSALLGAVYNFTNTFATSSQMDNFVFFPPTNLLASSVLTTSYALLSSTTLGTFTNLVPPIAKTLYGNAGSPSTVQNLSLAVASDTNGTAELTLMANANGSLLNGFACSIPFRLPLTQYNFAVKAVDTAARNKIVIYGYGL